MSSLTDVSIFNEQGLKSPKMPLLYLQSRFRSTLSACLSVVVDLESKMGIRTGFSFPSQGFISKRLCLYQYLLTGVVTQDERNCDHKMGKTSKQENHFSLSRPTG